MAAHVHSALVADVLHVDLQGYVAARAVGDLWYVEGDLVVGLHQLLVVNLLYRARRSSSEPSGYFVLMGGGGGGGRRVRGETYSVWIFSYARFTISVVYYASRTVY